MCIIKEINMLDLNANDRQMSLNEVKVLSKMDHPNIVGENLKRYIVHTQYPLYKQFCQLTGFENFIEHINHVLLIKDTECT